jgi:hypothetical protein
MNHFTKSFDYFKSLLEAGTPFALARFGDGELSILRGERIRNHEFQYDGERGFMAKIVEAICYQHPDYFVGIGCPCCIGQKDFEWMRDVSCQPTCQLTYNNIFVNSNYKRFMAEIVPILEQKNAIFTGPEEGRQKLPYQFGIEVNQNAWRFAEEYLLELVDLILNESRPRIFLFSAGPLSEYLIHRAHIVAPEHTYIDIGSTLDPLLFGHPTRGYHTEGSPTSNKICYWG